MMTRRTLASSLVAALALLLLLPSNDAFLFPTTRTALTTTPSLATRHTVQPLRMSDSDNDFASQDYPSDYDPDADTSNKDLPKGSTFGEMPVGITTKRDSIKSEIYQLAATTNRGQLANADQQGTILNLVQQLEMTGTTPSVSGEPLNGRWELVYSDVAPFRASPFFLTIGKLFGTQSSAEDFFRLHRLATSGSEIGRVFQILGETEMSSEIEITTGVPSIPFAITGTVVSKASVTSEGKDKLRLALKSSTVTKSSLLPFQLPEVSIGDLVAQVGGADLLPKVTMTNTYLDSDLRISRTEDDHFFIFSRVLY